ncbi:DUF2460 domain-containing protein [Metabacillus sp. GX 13764]|uniref:DUF2460 domain-containing protein n=1 Tax=Metabacillus kandeliae TaxID=2900151 RepID=UPI001E60B90E|nr:DUF2460 domain-containing protein [Metabacillus kandeliae]MCD7034563.1 DUF2460 domain-containing protein [Metabacillus kandeliae]
MLSWESELYTEAVRPIEKYTGLSDSPMSFFMMNDKMYMMDGAQFLVFDGKDVKPVEPYIPTVSISKDPAGRGTAFEDFNLLGTGFKDSFTGDGTSKEFTLSLKGLDATEVKARVDNTDKKEGTDFTVDRAAGKVTFTTAPSKGTNNVVITAYKTIDGSAAKIKKCKFMVLYGGANDTRVFFSGNPDMPSYVWRSGLYDPTYWPENGFYKIGLDVEKVVGFSKQYDSLIVHKENSLWKMQYTMVDGEAFFPIIPLNDQVGTIASNSIQIVENNPVMLSKKGIYMLQSTNVRDERNVLHLSENIDSMLKQEPNIDKAITFDYDNKYWIAVNEKVYLFDYRVQEWLIYDNIPASCFLEIEETYTLAVPKTALYTVLCVLTSNVRIMTTERRLKPIGSPST